jgi:phosphohistidine phosphatase
MTRRIYFLRHGKAAPRGTWEGDDGLRPLTPEGEALMRREAAGLRRLGVAPDAIVTSPLVRARETAAIVAEALGVHDRLFEDARLAHGFDARCLERIAAARPEATDLMVVGHEPEFSATIAELIGGGFVDIKKGGLARVDVSGPGLEDGVLAWLLTPALLAGE